MKGYPVFLIGLDRRRCVVVGGGGEAQRKVEGLLECDAAVTVIASRVTDGIRRFASERRVIWLRRDYRAGDLRGLETEAVSRLLAACSRAAVDGVECTCVEVDRAELATLLLGEALTAGATEDSLNVERGGAVSETRDLQ